MLDAIFLEKTIDYCQRDSIKGSQGYYPRYYKLLAHFNLIFTIMSVELTPLPLQVPLIPYLIHRHLCEIRVKPANPTLHHIIVNPYQH